MFNEQYYKDKKQKLNEKFENKKNIFLQNLFNQTASLQQDLNDITAEFKEIEKAEEENKKKDNVPNQEKSE